MHVPGNSYATNNHLIREKTSANRTIRELKTLSICGIHSKLPAAQANFKCKESKSGKFVKGKTPPKPRYEK